MTRPPVELPPIPPGKHIARTVSPTNWAKLYRAFLEVLRPGGLMVTVTKNLRRKGRCFDLAAATVKLAEQAGFTYQQHVIAILAGIRDSALVARPSFWQLSQTRKVKAKGWPVHLVVHEDVLVFAKGGVDA